MDNVTAALLGTVAGSLATIAAAVAGPAISSRASFRHQRQREIREEIARVLHSFLTLLTARRNAGEGQLVAHTDAVTAVTRLAVLLGPRERDVQSALDYALTLVANEKYAAGAAATESLRIVLHAWYRGEVKGKRIGDLYGAELDRALHRRTAQ